MWGACRLLWTQKVSFFIILEVSMFFGQDLSFFEGRRCADPGIKLLPLHPPWCQAYVRPLASLRQPSCQASRRQPCQAYVSPGPGPPLFCVLCPPPAPPPSLKPWAGHSTRDQFRTAQVDAVPEKDVLCALVHLLQGGVQARPFELSQGCIFAFCI